MSVRVGIDFGGVIVRNRPEAPGEDTSFSGSEGTRVAQPGVFEVIREMVHRCDGQVWIVSKARERMQARTLAWLEDVDFQGRTGLDCTHVRFCLEREGKAGICKELAITHFIDDRVHVMQILEDVVPHLYLFGEHGEADTCPGFATFVTGWPLVAEILEPFLPPR